jgi:hypothetical protein
MSEAHDLGTVQRWMQAVLMHPGGVSAGIVSDDAQREIALTPAELEQVIARSKALPAAERLEVYSNAYYARLLECLREEFPALVHALGQELFDEFAVGYLQRHPSRSYTLARLAEHFPRYLVETRPEEDDSSWTDFLIDLATLELAINEVFDGPGTESDAALQPDQLAGLPVESWADARLEPVPCLRLLTLRFPLHRYYKAVRRGKDVTPPDAAATYLALSRRDYVVQQHELAADEFAVLGGLMNGLTVGEAIVRPYEDAESFPDNLGEQLRVWFRRWSAEGFFRAVHLST